jgi:hypothetical protein
MLRLGANTEEVTVALPGGAALTCVPATTAIVYAARSRADLLLADLVSAGEAVSKAGGRIEGGPDLDSPDGVAGARQSLFVLSIAELAAIAWSGIGDADGNELEFQPELLAMLLVQPAVADAFQSQYLRPIYEAVAEGNV